MLIDHDVDDEWILPAAVGAVTLIAVLAFPRNRLRRVDAVRRQRTAQWQAFERWTQDFPRLSDDPPATLELWKRILVYGVAFGTADRMIQSGRIPVPVTEEASTGSYWWSYASAGSIGDSLQRLGVQRRLRRPGGARELEQRRRRRLLGRRRWRLLRRRRRRLLVAYSRLLQPLGEPVHPALAGGGRGARPVGRPVLGALDLRVAQRRDVLEGEQVVAAFEQAGAQLRPRLARSPRRARASSEPCLRSSSAAVFSPTPLAPGMPSEGSPRRAMKSGTSSGGIP